VGKIILSCSGLLLFYETGVRRKESGVRSQESGEEMRIKENEEERRIKSFRVKKVN
jgi:hypothetical protein